MIKKIILGAVGIFLLVIGIGFLMPSTYTVERNVRIDAPAENIFRYVKNLRQWQRWGVWFKRDPDMHVSYSGPESAVGMQSSWSSESQGNGRMEVIGMEENHRIIYSLYFIDMDMGSTGELVFSPSEDQTLVTWRDYGDVGANPLYRYFAFFMDSMIGDDLQIGLDNLKVISEANDHGNSN
ncbi:MAG: hypothetical protein ACJA13_001721 [Paraglaciecola sp.]|jgi:uncharacterized protein YndB with AHSA1/START domain